MLALRAVAFIQSKHTVLYIRTININLKTLRININDGNMMMDFTFNFKKLTYRFRFIPSHFFGYGHNTHWHYCPCRIQSSCAKKKAGCPFNLVSSIKTRISKKK